MIRSRSLAFLNDVIPIFSQDLLVRTCDGDPHG